MIGSLAPEPHPASAAFAHGVVADELDAGGRNRGRELHERVDIAADHVRARFHPLDRRQRKAAKLGELALVDAEKGPRGPQLRCGDQASTQNWSLCVARGLW